MPNLTFIPPGYPARGSDGLILIVNEEPVVRAALALCLRAEGHAACMCASLDEAASMLGDVSTSIQLVIFSCRRRTAFSDIVRIVKQSRHPAASVMILCDDCHSDDVFDGVACAVAQLTSPFVLMELVDEILQPPRQRLARPRRDVSALAARDSVASP